MASAPVASVSFAQVRKAARVVAERAAHVGVVTAKADELAGTYATGPRTAVLPRGLAPEHALPFLVLRATLRFGSGYEPKLRLEPGETSADSLDAALVEHFASSGPPAPRDMVHATAATTAALRRQGLEDAPQAEFVELQARAIRDLGRFLIDRHEGSFDRLVESAQHSAARLCESLATMPYFNDVQRYRGLDVQFFHRAQRLAAEVAEAWDRDGLGRFDDLRELAPSSDADCALALRTAGVLSYGDQLADRVDHGEIVPAHSEREVEIRAAALYAAERVTAAIQARRPEVSAVEVDAWLRSLAGEARRAGREPHRTRTVLY